MQKDIFSALKEDNAAFSKGQKKIAEYLINYADSAAFMTAGALASEVGVSESTVVRFATQMGYDGFPQMQKKLQEQVLHKLKSPTEIGNDVSGQNPYFYLCQEESAQITDCLIHNTQDKFVHVANILKNAETVYVVGYGLGAILAQYAVCHLATILKNVKLITNADEDNLCREFHFLSDKDTVLFYDYGRNNTMTQKVVALCHPYGASLIFITPERNTEKTNFEEVFVAENRSESTVLPISAPLFITRALICTLCEEYKNGI